MTPHTNRGRPRHPNAPRTAFSRVLNTWMRRHGLSLQQAAEALGRPYSSVSNWSQGRRSPARSGASPTQYDLVVRDMRRYDESIAGTQERRRGSL